MIGLYVHLGSEPNLLYCFDQTPAYEVDYEMANYFVYSLIAAKATTEGRYTLRGTRFSRHVPSQPSQHQKLKSTPEVKDVLTDIFGIRLPTSEVFERKLQHMVLS